MKDLWAELLRRFESQGVILEVTRHELSLDGQDGVTGQYYPLYNTDSTIKMPIEDQLPRPVLTAMGQYVKADAVGYTETAINEGDCITDANGREFKVLTVMPVKFGDYTPYYQCQLANVSAILPNKIYEFPEYYEFPEDWKESETVLLPTLTGTLHYNQLKPYLYNGYYYIFFEVGTNFYYVFGDGTSWSSPILIIADIKLNSDSVMCLDNKVMVTYIKYESAYGNNSVYSITGTIQSDHTISFGIAVIIWHSTLQLLLNWVTSELRVVKIGSSRKWFVVSGNLNTINPNNPDWLYISDDDGQTWSSVGYCNSSVPCYGRLKLEPFADGNKLLEFRRGGQSGTLTRVLSRFRNGTGSVCGSEVAANDVWCPYVFDYIGLGYFTDVARCGNYIHLTGVNWSYSGNYYYVKHARVNINTPETWENLGEVAPNISFPYHDGRYYFCTCPIGNSVSNSVYVIWSVGSQINARKWSSSGYGPIIPIYTEIADLYNLTAYPLQINRKILLVWNYVQGGITYIHGKSILL